MSRPENRHDDDRTGNGIVNHGPENTPNSDPEPTADERDTGESEGDGGDALAGVPAGGPQARGSEDDDAPEADRTAAEDDADAERAVADVSGSGVPGPGVPDAGIPGGNTAGADRTPAALFGGGASEGVPDDAYMDEVALRRMLHGAVGGCGPLTAPWTACAAPCPPGGPGGVRPWWVR